MLQPKASDREGYSEGSSELNKKNSAHSSRGGPLPILKAMFRTMRPHQWVKNLLLFAGLIFSQNFFNPELVVTTAIGFALFCCLTSGLYIINDLVDLDKDRNHPRKSQRPLASGALNPKIAVLQSFTLLSIALAGGVFMDQIFGALMVTYLVVNILYCFWLKHLVIIDVFVLAFDFVIRAVAGAAIIHVTVSHWLVLCTFLLSLFLGFGKRRQELILLKENASAHRRSLE